MLFINETPTHVAIRSEIKPLFDTKGNQIQPKQRRVWAKFKRGEAPDYARAIGMETFAMLDRPVEVDPGAWLSAYDSVAAQQAEGWTDEERQLIEETLVDRGYLAVERPRVAAPYPMYDKHRKTAGKRTIDHVIADITAAYESAGFDVELAKAYERENGDNAQVLAALDALVSTDEPVEVEETVIAA